jgi:ketosteroid isomerase-like protein
LGILGAMSRENVDVIRALFDAWNDGDLAAVRSFMAEGIEWLEVEGRTEKTTGEEVRGRDAVHSGLEELFETWQHYRLEPEDVRDVGDERVVAVIREVARGRLSGAELSSRWGYVITIREGKLVRVEAYRDPDQALASAGHPSAGT